MTITDLETVFNEAWDQLVNTCNDDVKEIGDRLLPNQDSECPMTCPLGPWTVSKDPGEEHVWSHTQSECIAYQQ